MMKVEELKNKVAQETAARDGLMKMKGVYEANPNLGDARTIESKYAFVFFLSICLCPNVLKAVSKQNT